MNTTTTRVPLVLPKGRKATVICGSADLSITGALRATHGNWEPHIRSFLERNVRHDWVCLDIGANIGIHTLSMSVLATDGQVVAFEADEQNFRWLCSNLRDLDETKAAVTEVNCALWDTNGFVNLSSIEELSGCCFISESENVAENERRIREVVNPAAIKEIELHMRVSATPAVRLDDWIAKSGLKRIDLIKMDVEGAETRVLRGAERTIREFAPILVTEYNPACGAHYFGTRPSDYFEELKARFEVVRIIETDGSISAPLQDWDALDARLKNGRGWEDLYCEPKRAATERMTDVNFHVG
jgi:FkbM family methyltransferase